VVAHACHLECFLKQTLFLVLLWKNKKNKTQFYFRFENTFVSQMFFKWEHFRCKNKLFFQNKNIFDLNKNYFRLGNTFNFVSETLGKKTEKKIVTKVESLLKCFHLRRLSTFQTTGLQASIFKYCLTAPQPPLPIRTIHPLLLAKRYNSLTLSHKLHVLCHKSLKDISPRIGYHNKERLRLV